MNSIKMIVGLSNPKAQYHNTRHNVGSWFLYYLAKSFLIIFKEKKKFLGFTSELNIESKCILLLIPNIFMNINGQSVLKIASFYNISLNEILVVHDDLELQPGIIKLKYGYGHNGHNGLRSVIKMFEQKNNFYRLRIGIGRPQDKKQISSFVLSIPDNKEKILIQKSIKEYIRKNFHLILVKEE